VATRVNRRSKIVERPEEQVILDFIFKLRAKKLDARRIAKQIDAQFTDVAPSPDWKVRNITSTQSPRSAQG